jgi:hypothetical protein
MFLIFIEKTLIFIDGGYLSTITAHYNSLIKLSKVFDNSFVNL